MMSGVTAAVDVYRALGRPVPAAVLEHPRVVDGAWRRLTMLLGQGVLTLRVGGEAGAEAVVLAALAVVASRARRRGSSVQVVGEALTACAAPPRPAAEIAILLEAPFYAELGAWSQAQAGKTAVLVGEAREWRRLGEPMDLVLEGLPEEAVTAVRQRWRRLVAEQPEAALAAGLGCDLSEPGGALVDVHRAGTLRPAGCFSLDTGVWLARDELVRRSKREPMDEAVGAMAGRGARFSRAVELWEEQCGIGWS